MGKAKVTAEIGAGKYTCEIVQDNSYAEKIIDEKAGQIVTLTAEIVIYEADRLNVLVDLGFVEDNLRAAISNEDKSLIESLTEEFSTLNIELSAIEQTLRKKKVEKLKAEKRKSFLESKIQAPVTKDLWCASYSEGAEIGGTYGTIEISREDKSESVLLDGMRQYNAAVDGQLMDGNVNSPAASLLNFALMPAHNIWNPRYRSGKITYIDHVNNEVALTLDRSFFNGIDQNSGVVALSEVPVSYGVCNSESFSVGDHVIIEYTAKKEAETDSRKPVVIGFVTDPVECFPNGVGVDGEVTGKSIIKHNPTDGFYTAPYGGTLRTKGVDWIGADGQSCMWMGERRYFPSLNLLGLVVDHAREGYEIYFAGRVIGAALYRDKVFAVTISAEDTPYVEKYWFCDRGDASTIRQVGEFSFADAYGITSTNEYAQSTPWLINASCTIGYSHKKTATNPNEFRDMPLARLEIDPVKETAVMTLSTTEFFMSTKAAVTGVSESPTWSCDGTLTTIVNLVDWDGDRRIDGKLIYNHSKTGEVTYSTGSEYATYEGSMAYFWEIIFEYDGGIKKLTVADASFTATRHVKNGTNYDCSHLTKTSGLFYATPTAIVLDIRSGVFVLWARKSVGLDEPTNNYSWSSLWPDSPFYGMPDDQYLYDSTQITIDIQDGPNVEYESAFDHGSGFVYITAPNMISECSTFANLENGFWPDYNDGSILAVAVEGQINPYYDFVGHCSPHPHDVSKALYTFYTSVDSQTYKVSDRKVSWTEGDLLTLFPNETQFNFSTTL